MTRSNFLYFAGIAVAGIAACLAIQHRLQVKLNNGQLLRSRQEEQLATLTKEHERLSKRVISGKSRDQNELDNELDRLREESTTLRAQTNELARRLEQASVVTRPPEAPPASSRTPEFYTELRKLAGTKPTEARDLALAFTSYAWDHDSQGPANLDILNAYMAEQKSRPLSGSNQFEIIYHGSLEKLKGIPLNTVAVIREKNSWPGPDGTKIRLYGMALGSSEMVESNDDFKAWEDEHIIAP